MGGGQNMKHNGRKIVIVGGGIAGLCAAVYALKCGYDAEVLEMHDMAGGLAMSWRRGPYTFETCLHWLIGSNPRGEFHEQWKEVFEIDRLKFINPREFVRIETEKADCLRIYTNANLLEAELMAHAPQDEEVIHEFVHSVRTLGKFKMLDPSGGLAQNWLPMLQDVPILPLLRRLGKMSGKEYGDRFSDPLLREFFSTGDVGKLSATAMVLSLGWMNENNAGYCIGGSQAIIRLIEERIRNLGGRIRYKARVHQILVERDVAVGVQLESGEKVLADWVISAADGHATIFNLLGGKYVDDDIRKIYDERNTFASYLQVSLGVAMDMAKEPAMLTRIIEDPIRIDPETESDHIAFRFFHYDPTFAPPGKTAVTSIVPTRNHRYWEDLRNSDPTQYRIEKARVAEAVISVLEKRIPHVRKAIEVVDVSTPASVIRYTGNWKGSQEGWLFEPGGSFKSLPNTLPGLGRFMMVGQWVMPGGGLPSGPMTARPAIKTICRHDHVSFDVHPEPEPAVA
jgi:phytoene dehydrogenase-like protein